MDAIKFHSDVSKKFDSHYYKSSLFRERFHLWTSLIDKYLQPDDGVLDAGCGSGIFSFYIAKKGNKVTAIDGSEKMIGLCKKKMDDYENIDLKFLIERLPFNDVSSLGKFDFIISSSVLEYITEYDHCLDDFKKLLNTNGILIISFPNEKGIYRKIEKISFNIFKRPKYLIYVKNMLSVKKLNSIMEKKGFKTLDNQFYTSNTFLNKILKCSFIPKENRNSLFVGVYKKI